MERHLKIISKDGIPHALEKVEHYRYLNQAEEAESICRDILAVEPEQQLALRLLGLSITDQFTGRSSDRYREAENCFERLSSAYERSYYLGILAERRAKVQLRTGQSPQALLVDFQQAMRYFEEAEKIRPRGNDDAVLRWNRCARLLETIPEFAPVEEPGDLDTTDSPPLWDDELRAGTRKS